LVVDILRRGEEGKRERGISVVITVDYSLHSHLALRFMDALTATSYM